MAHDREVQAVIRGLTKVTEKVITKITFDVVANLVESTPVDTGWARANWVPAIGSPSLPDLSKVQPTSALAASAASKQQGALASVAAGYKLSRGSVFISNNVPYITQLNLGSSTQEPSGFVQRAIRKAVTQDIKGLSV